MFSYLLSNPLALIMIFVGLGWAWLNLKNFISWFRVEKLTKEQEKVEQKISDIPKEVADQTPQENVDFWNNKDPNSGH